MEKKTLIVTISAAVLLVIASFSSVIGSNDEQSSQKIESPLFAVRTQRSVHTDSEQTIQSHYLGKGMNSHLFRPMQPSLNNALDRTIKLLNANPDFFAKFLKTLSSNPRVLALLEQNGMTVAEFKTYLNRLKNDPSLFIDEIRSAGPKLSAQQLKTPLPLSLNTTNPFACVITAIVMIPVVLIIALIVVVFTLRILQCLNFSEVINQIMDQVLQELYPAGFNN
ncbi:MAG: hypothetical protein NTY91_00825 [Euryarchaeota archaeon]|jgi:hypothetical protein|nr:hypothetical protein [Euryarchaeota archaeon]